MTDNVTTLKSKNWVSRFNLIGKPVITDYTFDMDKQSQRSSWVYNQMKLLVDCGEKFGSVQVNLMGGYSPDRNNQIRVHLVGDDGKIDYKNATFVDWEDRKDPSVIENVASSDIIKIGLEKTTEGKNFIKHFLSAYDAIEYIKSVLTPDMTISVNGNISYSIYNDKVYLNLDVRSMYLSNAELNNYRAHFVQSVILDKDSANMKDIDKSTGVMNIDAIVIDYVKEMNGHEIRGQFPYHYNFEWKFNLDKQELCKKIYNKFFNIKKGYTQITFEGDFLSGGATVQTTWDDVPDDIKELVELEIYTKEEALAKCATNGSRETHMRLTAPYIIKTDNGSDMQIFPEHYTEEELDFSWVYSDDDADTDEDNDELPFGNDESESDGSTGDDDMSWLNDL